MYKFCHVKVCIFGCSMFCHKRCVSLVVLCSVQLSAFNLISEYVPNRLRLNTYLRLSQFTLRVYSVGKDSL